MLTPVTPEFVDRLAALDAESEDLEDDDGGGDLDLPAPWGGEDDPLDRGELESDDYEPSLGSIGSGDPDFRQTGWDAGGHCGFELDLESDGLEHGEARYDGGC